MFDTGLSGVQQSETGPPRAAAPLVKKMVGYVAATRLFGV